MDARKITKTAIKQYAGVQKHQLNGIIRGNKNYTVDTLIKVMSAVGLQLSCENLLK